MARLVATVLAEFGRFERVGFEKDGESASTCVRQIAFLSVSLPNWPAAVLALGD